MNKRAIVIIIIFLVMLAVIVEILFYPRKNNTTNENNEQINTQRYSVQVDEFYKLFSNTTNYQNYNLSYVNKVYATKEIIYTNNSIVDKKSGNYDINIKIPAFNINNEKIKKINEEISSTFEEKAKNIMIQTNDSEEETVYTVDYCAYVNQNIISLAIKSTLKEKDNEQRLIIKTYTINLATNEQLSLEEMLNIKNINKNNVQKIINNEIKANYELNEELENVGASAYKRDINSEIYNIENSECYLLGENNQIYVIYPYGNSNFTSEMDVILVN